MTDSIPTGNIFQGEKPSIEWIGPKILVIVRCPENTTQEFKDELKSSLQLEHYAFIAVFQDNIEQVEFEYPKNYFHPKTPPSAIINTELTDEDRENMKDAFNFK